MPSSKPLNVLVLGAGIAGLSAAIGLRRAGHHVRILEQSTLSNEVGAAVHVCPNAARILLAWGLDPVRARFVTAKQNMLAEGQTLKCIFQKDLEDIESRYGAPWFFAHRVDLHRALMQLAMDQNGQGKPVAITVCSRFVNVDPTRGVVDLSNCTLATADVIVAADGVHSRAVAHVIGSDVSAEPTGVSAFRFMLPHEVIAGDVQTAPLLNNDEGRMKIFILGDRRLVWYPCRDGTEHNFVLIHPDKSSAAKEEWNVTADSRKLMNNMANFHPDLLAVCQKASDVKLWKLLYREPIDKWHEGRLVLAGDAAHPMLPHQGQGGAQAIEDGAALEVAFADFNADPSLSNLKPRFKLYEDIRMNRASAMQVLSNAGQDEPGKIREAAKKYIPEDEIPGNPAEFMEYNFGFDVHEVGTKLRRVAEQKADWV